MQLTTEVGAEVKRLLRLGWHRDIDTLANHVKGQYDFTTALAIALGHKLVEPLTSVDQIALVEQVVSMFLNDQELRMQFARTMLRAESKPACDIFVRNPIYRRTNEYLCEGTPRGVARGIVGYLIFLEHVIFKQLEDVDAFIDLVCRETS